MSQPRSSDPLRRAIRKLVLGLEKREKIHRERRRYNRQPFEVKVQLCSQVDAHQYQPICDAWAIDLSMGGVRCLTDQAIEPEGNSSIYVSFEEMLGHPCYIPICVRRCQNIVGTIYQINGQFIYDSASGPGESNQAA